jgi:hypothetical protein
MFRTSYVHHQEDYIEHAALYGTFFMHLCKQSTACINVVFMMMNIRSSKRIDDKKN